VHSGTIWLCKQMPCQGPAEPVADAEFAPLQHSKRIHYMVLPAELQELQLCLAMHVVYCQRCLGFALHTLGESSNCRGAGSVTLAAPYLAADLDHFTNTFVAWHAWQAWL
jgi:hypothetical protein